jgi:hypothetical protein
MKVPRGLSGARLADALCQHWQYKKVHQVGSHIILETEMPSHQRIAILDHLACVSEHSLLFFVQLLGTKASNGTQ